jgi:hypothetical protein
MIYIKHTELSGNLACDYKYMNNKEECYIRNYKGEFSEERESVN